MSSPLKEKIKICKKHGELSIDNIIKKGKSKNGNQMYRCKLCMKELHNKYYSKNKKSILDKVKLYRKTNKEKVREWKLEYFHKYKDRDKEKRRKRDKKYYDASKNELNDRYVKHLITKRTGMKYSDIPDSLVGLKRTLLLTKQIIKKRKIDNRR